jgi:hypothetical protein
VGTQALEIGVSFRRNKAAIFKRLLSRVADCLDFEANEGDIDALSGLCVSTTPGPPPSQGGERMTSRATKTRGWQRLPHIEKRGIFISPPWPPLYNGGERKTPRATKTRDR